MLPAAFHRLLCGLTQCGHVPTTIDQTPRRDSSVCRCASSSTSTKSTARHNAGSSTTTNFGLIVAKSIVLLTMAFTNLSYHYAGCEPRGANQFPGGFTPSVDHRHFSGSKTAS